MGYTKDAISGFSWHTVLKFSSYGLTFVKIFFLARLLGPEAFGLFSLTMIALGITEAVTETGINITLVQSQKPVSHFINTAWVIAISRGFIISLCMVALGWGLSGFYDQPQLLSLVILAAVVPIIKGFINPAIVSYYKDLSFKWDSLYRFSLVLVDGLAAVVLVLVTNSVYGWLSALLVTALFEVLISFIFFSPKPTFKWDPKVAREIWSNAKWLSLSSFFTYLHENVDNLIVGKISGTFNLGLYQNAYALAHKPNYDIVKSFHHSTLPIYVRLQTDLPRLKRAFKKTVLLASGISLVASLPLFIAPTFLVRLVLGEQWLSIVPLIGWLTLAGIFHAITLLGYSALVATSRMKWMNIHQVVTVTILILSLILAGSVWGLMGMTIAIAFSRIITLPILVVGVRKVFSQTK